MCSDLDIATTRSFLPWDPAEETGVSRDCVLSSYSSRGASLKKLNADVEDSYDYHQQPGELLSYLFDSAGPFAVSRSKQQECMDRYSVTAVVSRLLINSCDDAQ
jgi:hypothetical protein